MSVQRLADDTTVIQRIFAHIDHHTTDLGDATWREPVANYLSPQRLTAEVALLQRSQVPFCPSAALPEPGSYVARNAAGTPLLAVRGEDGRVRVFRNACRHRGTQLVGGSGCGKKAFACPYHGWVYALDGTLRHVPDAHGFPGLDQPTRGLVPVASREAHGLVFVSQAAEPAEERELADLPALVPPDYGLINVTERENEANWKVLVEGFLEGYHIRATHSTTFYPRQFDNLNVVERFGRNNRIAFPYRAINKLREKPPVDWSTDGTLTYVYHLFPNAMVATFPQRIILVVIEPLALDRTNLITYSLSNRDARETETEHALRRDTDFVNAGAIEDREVACAIQRSLTSGANEFFEFGLFEGAIVHFHRTLHAALGEHGARHGA